MSGGGSSPAPAPSNTTSQNTTTYIQDVPAWEQQYLSNLLGQASSEATQPYQQFPGTQVAPLTADQTQSFSNVENLANNGSWQPTQAAGTISALQGANTANNISAAGSPYYQASAAYNPLATASPYLNAAANTATPQGISSYMSPYTNDVVSGLVNTANQNWNNTIMPGVNDAFIGSGQFASGRNAQVLGQAANTFQTNLNSNVANALESGYGQASTNAANQAGILGNLAGTGASAASSEAANLQGAGAGLGNLAATQSSAQQGAGANLASIGNTALNSGITANAALQDVGQQQQQQSQNNINVAEQNFQNQTQWPETQTSFLSDIIRGLPAMGSSGTTATQTPTTTNQIGSVSPLSTLAGTLLGAGGVGSVAGGAKKGGLIKGFAAGGLVDPPTPDEIDEQMHPGDDMSPMQAAVESIPSHTALPPGASGERAAFNPLQSATPQVADNDNQARGLQLLAMARGFLTPVHSGAEALGNAVGGLEGSIYKEPAYEGEQQDVIGKKLGNYKDIYGLALQNARMQAMGGPQMPLPNIPGMPDLSQAGFSSPSFGQQMPSGPSAAPSSGTSGLLPNNKLFSYLTNPQLLASATAAQKQQIVIAAKQLGYPLPQGFEESAFAGGIQSAKTNAEQQAILDHAKAIETAKTQGQVIQGPNGPIPAGSVLAAGPPAPAKQSASLAAAQPPGESLLAADGKPIIPAVATGAPFASDPSGTPKISVDPQTNTATGVEAAKETSKQAIDKAYKDNEAFTTNLSSLQTEDYRIKQLMDLYGKMQSGTAVAQWPEMANQLASIGAISDPSTIKNLAGVQTAAANHALQIIQQIKDTNANMGSQPTRTFGSEISNLQENGENAKNRPEALYSLLTQARGIVQHHIDMVNGWNAIGGLGNRLAGGNTLMPDDYARQFMASHNIEDYKNKVAQETPPFKGMASTKPPPNVQDIVDALRKRGHVIK